MKLNLIGLISARVYSPLLCHKAKQFAQKEIGASLAVSFETLQSC